MPSVSVSVDVPIPANTLIYDLGLEQFSCKVCKSTVKYSAAHPPVERQGERLPSVSQVFKGFAENHGECLLKQERQQARKRAREEANQPCRQDYRDSNGHGPHECGKRQGHYGGCGPS